MGRMLSMVMDMEAWALMPAHPTKPWWRCVATRCTGGPEIWQRMDGMYVFIFDDGYTTLSAVVGHRLRPADVRQLSRVLKTPRADRVVSSRRRSSILRVLDGGMDPSERVEMAAIAPPRDSVPYF